MHGFIWPKSILYIYMTVASNKTVEVKLRSNVSAVLGNISWVTHGNKVPESSFLESASLN